MNKIEILTAWSHGTWSTSIEDIPDDIDREDNTAVVNWCYETLIYESRFDGAVAFAIYHSNPEFEEDDQ